MKIIRNIGIWLSLTIANFGADIAGSGEHFSLREYIGLKVDAFGCRMFGVFYTGSDQEIEDALTYTEEEWPSEHMSERQIKARINAPDDSAYAQSTEWRPS